MVKYTYKLNSKQNIMHIYYMVCDDDVTMCYAITSNLIENYSNMVFIYVRCAYVYVRYVVYA